jgi:uncharacterized protein YciI
MRKLTLAALLLAAVSAVAMAQSAPTQPAPQAAPAPAQKTWFVRLIPPRPTFANDMTETEQALMSAHFEYWKAMFQKGVCLFGGPVLDPKGVYGVLAIVAANEDEARAIASADPSVKGGVNRIEVAEMRIAFPPKAN